MATKRHKPEEIVSKLRQVDVLVGQAMMVWPARVGSCLAMEARAALTTRAQVARSLWSWIRLYAGFPSRADENLMQAFHSGDWYKRTEIAESFEYARYRELARRRIFENAPQSLTNASPTS